MNHIGETNVNSKGERFIIREYRSSTDVDVVFELDNSAKNTTYAQVKSGHVSRSNADDGSDWIGEIIEDDNGEECKIVEVASDDKVTVQYKDGDIVSELSLEQIVSNNFNREEKQASSIKGNIKAERKQTLEHVYYLLQRFRRAVMIRPCGFGKTFIGLKLFFHPRYKKCLFLHPTKDDSNATKIKNTYSQKRIDTKTYSWLYHLSDAQIKALDYDIVFCDEVHCLGADESGNGAYVTYTAVKKLMETHPATHFVGATATPIRMDGYNAIATLFHNHICYPYTDEDAFDDGVLKRPYYYYNVYDVVKKIREEIKMTLNVEMSRDELQKTLHFSSEELDEIDTKYMDKHIRSCCDKVIKDTSYMRFIAFYLTNKDIDNNKDKVINWFKKAYPNHQIGSIVVTSSTDKSLKDVDALPTSPTVPGFEGRIDIIFNCEMLCMGYHSELITGLILDRKTQSLAKYMQMMGRLLSCDNDKPVIIFDVVDNLHSDFICKSHIKEDLPVTPNFSEKPMTFEEISKAYPYAIHWNEVNTAVKKAKKAEKILKDEEYLITKRTPLKKTGVEASTGITYTADDNIFIPTREEKPRNLDIDAKQAIENAWNVVAEKKMSFTEACNYLAEIEDEYGTTDLYDFSDEPEQENTVLRQAPYLGMYKTSVNPTESKISTATSVPVVKDVDKVNDAPVDDIAKDVETLGYNPRYYLDQNTHALYDKNVQVLNRHANFKEDYLAAYQTVQKSRFEEIIAEWHKINPACEENYTSYAEINKKSTKFILLKSCSEFLYGVNVEKTLLYMIEGKVA